MPQWLKGLWYVLIDIGVLLKFCVRKDYSKVSEEIEKLKADKKELMVTKAQNESVKRKVAQMKSFLDEAPTEITNFDDIMVRRYVKEIKIYDDRFHIIFKARFDLDVPRKNTK
ncbi:hypothetical protein [Butyrivibrio sp. MB2005]|uniref:hypothetical protein n=1 Tax=Butyrivibrio sp. MB2005 TaxID=1280678 RepID=UPI00047D0B78|nr:hypothetical protein [Butyrivibrio sp. MB2005]